MVASAPAIVSTFQAKSRRKQKASGTHTFPYKGVSSQTSPNTFASISRKQKPHLATRDAGI